MLLSFSRWDLYTIKIGLHQRPLRSPAASHFPRYNLHTAFVNRYELIYLHQVQRAHVRQEYLQGDITRRPILSPENTQSNDPPLYRLLESLWKSCNPYATPLAASRGFATRHKV